MTLPKSIRLFFFPFLLLFMASSAFSQRLNPPIVNEDSLQRVKQRDTLFKEAPKVPGTISYSRSQLQNYSVEGVTPDTTISDFHRINPVFRNSFAAINLGNIGLAEKKLFLYNPYPSSFRFREDPYGAYYFDPNQVRFYDTKSPYTDLFFSQAGKKEQIVRIVHSRSFKKYFNAGIDIQKIKSEGFLQRQAIDYGGVDVFMRFRSPSGRYIAATSYMRNKAVIQENGGLDFDTVPLFFVGDKAFLPVRMQAASNTSKIKSAFLDQTIFLGKKFVYDTLYKPEVKPFAGITHSICYDVKDDVFYDFAPDQLNYINPLPLSGKVYDSLRVKNLSNSVILHSAGNGIRPVLDHFKLYGKQEIISIGQFFTDTTFTNIHIGAEASRSVLKFLNVFASSRYTLDGYNAGDNSTIAGIETNRDSLSIYASVSVNSSQYEPDYFYSVSRSPVYQWYIDTLTKISLQEAKASVALFRGKLALQGTYSQIENYTYLDVLEAPKQFRGTLTYISGTLHGHLTIAKKWHFVHDILVQQISDTNIVHLPLYAGRLTYYYNNRIFKKRLEVEAGFEINYTEMFFADAYSPGLRSFYLQNAMQGGGYPFVDVFFKFKVKNRARIFFKFDHVNSGFIYKPSFVVPVYPMADRKFKFGVSWKFFD